jgi:predicted HicB family RNase H-like nuclease
MTQATTEREKDRTTVWIKRTVHDAASRAAESEYTTVGRWVEKVINEALERRRKRLGTRGPSRGDG